MVPGRDAATAEAERFDETRLLDRIARRETRAFEALYRTYHPRLTRFLMIMTRRAQLVEEVLDDTMMAVWERPGGYNGASKVSTWIFAIAYRKALKAMRRQDEPIEDPDEEIRPCSEPGPEQQLAWRQVQSALFSAIGELSADHRAVVDLAYYQGIGYREIAEIMDCPVDTVKTRMFHARRRLKAGLDGGAADWL
jgi:RNA polymerase sigma-70 factor (ECF subfamily)